ncbi:hypothetical protein ACFLY9_01680, partial [Patescibacteria group bacterium]
METEEDTLKRRPIRKRKKEVRQLLSRERLQHVMSLLNEITINFAPEVFRKVLQIPDTQNVTIQEEITSIDELQSNLPFKIRQLIQQSQLATRVHVPCLVPTLLSPDSPDLRFVTITQFENPIIIDVPSQVKANSRLYEEERLLYSVEFSYAQTDKSPATTWVYFFVETTENEISEGSTRSKQHGLYIYQKSTISGEFGEPEVVALNLRDQLGTRPLFELNYPAGNLPPIYEQNGMGESTFKDLATNLAEVAHLLTKGAPDSIKEALENGRGEAITSLQLLRQLVMRTAIGIHRGEVRQIQDEAHELSGATIAWIPDILQFQLAEIMTNLQTYTYPYLHLDHQSFL